MPNACPTKKKDAIERPYYTLDNRVTALVVAAIPDIT